jgi:hypothetical protein
VCLAGFLICSVLSAGGGLPEVVGAGRGKESLEFVPAIVL